MDLILTFHSIDTSGSVLSYAPSEFRQLVEGLVAEGVQFVGMDALSAASQPRSAAAPRVLITFDDGFTSVHEHALPVLAELGVPALLYVVTDWVGRDNRWPTQPANAPRFEVMSWSCLRELREGGFELGSHTANHVHVEDLTSAALSLELAGSKQRLEEELQQSVRHFAYPYGTYDSESAAQVGRHYETATTTDMRFLRPGEHPLRLPRIDAYYLRQPQRRLPLFGARTRAHLRMRATLRNLANLVRS